MALRVATGLERIALGDSEALDALRGKRLGLVAHPASVDSHLRHARQVLQSQGLDVRALFGPEHGYGGEAQDMVAVNDAAPSELPVYSLYGDSEAALSPTAEQLAGLDSVVIDLQDVGARYYTFVWTAVLVLRAAHRCGIQAVVLDRPNPLGGDVVEGEAQRTGYRSFVGLCDVAVRHGMSIGELCHMAAQKEQLSDALHVIEMRGYQRQWDYADTGLPWVFPSPNMPTFDTALVYPGGCLLEATNLSEGRGTTRPFEIWGAPFVPAKTLVDRVQADGVALRALSFSPMFHKHARQRCFGVQVHVTDRRKLRSYELYLRLIAQTRQLASAEFSWRTEPYEFVSDRPAIDLLTGGPEFRLAVDDGEAEALEAVLVREREGARRFERERSPYLLYP